MTDLNKDTRRSGRFATAEQSALTESIKSWSEPEKFQSTKRQAFDLNWLPKPVGEYCEELSKGLQVSTDMTAVCALSVLSVACQTHSIEIKSGWEESLNLYTLIVAEPGERKSPVLNKLKRPLLDWTSFKNSVLKDEIASSRAKHSLLKKKLAKAETDALKGVGSEDEVIQLSTELANFTPMRKVQLIADDITSERLVSLMQEQGEQMAIISSEGGIVSTIAGRYNSGEVNADIYLKSFYSEAVQVDRIGRDSDTLDNPILSVLLCVQPTVLEKLLSNGELKGNGLVDRFIYIVPPTSIGKARFNAPPVLDKTEVGYKNIVINLLEDRENKKYLTLSHEATDLFSNYYDWFNEVAMVDDFSEIKGWASKHMGIVARISGIIQLSTDGETIVSKNSMQKAISISKYLCEQANIILGNFAFDKETENAKYLLDKIISSGKGVLSVRDIQRKCRRFKSKSELISPLQVLIDMNCIGIDSETPLETLTEIKVNPVLLERRQSNERS